MSAEEKKMVLEQGIIEHAGFELAQAWLKYTYFFGEPPHGTARQLSALLELCPMLRSAIISTLSDASKSLGSRAEETIRLMNQNGRDESVRVDESAPNNPEFEAGIRSQGF